MILVTLGTQKFQMNRLIEAVDRIAPNYEDEFCIQIGYSTYEPVNCRYSRFYPTDQMKEMINNCNLLIAHAGVGTVMTGISAKRPIIVVPRLAKLAEHVDDHQCEIADAFANKGCVIKCTDTDKLAECIQKAKTYDFKTYTEKGENIEDIIYHFIGLFDPSHVKTKVST